MDNLLTRLISVRILFFKSYRNSFLTGLHDPLYAVKSFVIRQNDPEFEELKTFSSTFQLQRNQANAAR